LAGGSACPTSPSNGAPLLFLKPEKHPAPLHQDRPLDEVRIGRHELDRFFARRWVLPHAAFAIEFVARIQKQAVIPVANQVLQFFSRDSLVQIDFFESRAPFAQETPGFTAAGSSGLEVQFHGNVILRF